MTTAMKKLFETVLQTMSTTTLTDDLQAAADAAREACEAAPAGGTCNADSAWVCLPWGYQAEIEAAAAEAGLRVFSVDALDDTERSRSKLLKSKSLRDYRLNRARAYAAEGLRTYHVRNPLSSTADQQQGFKNTAQAKAIVATMQARGWQAEVHYLVD